MLPRQWRIQGGGAQHVPPSTDQNFLNFMQFLGKFDKNYMLHPLWRVYEEICEDRVVDYQTKLGNLANYWNLEIPETLKYREGATFSHIKLILEIKHDSHSLSLIIKSLGKWKCEILQ